MRRPTSFVALVVTLNLILFQTGQSDAELMHVVSPAAYADTEAPKGINQANPQGRYQTVYPASDFQSLPVGIWTITQFAYRPNGEITTPLQGSYESITVRLSTTSANPGSLSMTFADNIGADEVVVLSAIDFVVSTENLGPAGGPKIFDMDHEFQTPFEYDPSQGNLLMDISFTWGEGGFSVDGVGNAVTDTQAIGGEILGEIALWSNSGVVTQFTFVPDPGDFDFDGDVDGADFLAWQLNDGSQSGLDEWQAAFGNAARPATTTVPEPSTELLLVLGMATLLLRRDPRA